MAAGRLADAAYSLNTKPAAGVADFEALLRKAATGSAASGLGVEIDPSVGVELSDEQAQRLSEAADMAKSQGFDRALVMLDGQGYVLDVAQRRVVAKVDAAEAGAVGDIDGVVSAPPSAEPMLLAEPKGVPGGVGGGAGAASAVSARMTPGDALLRMLDRAWERPA